LFFRKVVTRRHGRAYTYLKLIENYREDGKIKQRVIANLGNIERFSPERVQALIAGLARIYDGAMLENEVTEAAQFDDHLIDHEVIRGLWRGLGLADLARAAIRDRDGLETFLIEAAILHEVLHPKGNHSLSACYASTVPELKGQDVSAVHFHHALTRFSRASSPVEVLLLDRLHGAGLIMDTETIVLKLISSDFTGFQCTLSPSGLLYEVRPYHHPIELAVVSSSNGLPLSCRVGFTPFSGQDIVNLVAEVNTNLHPAHCIVSDVRRRCTNELDELPLEYLATVSASWFAEVPINLDDVWNGRDVTAMCGRWVKSMDTRQARYIACYNPAPDAVTDHIVDEYVDHAIYELERLRGSVQKGRIRRRRTVLRRLTDILKRHQALSYFEYDLGSGSDIRLDFDLNLESMERDKTLRRTRVFKTNLFDVPVQKVVELFQHTKRVEANLELIRDHTKIPIVPSLTDSLHSIDFIAGQTLVHVLGETLRRLEDQYGPRILERLER
jgi:hypothetical protein